eukprot:jgi/Tetstr1/465071/TSEL_009799.t1
MADLSDHAILAHPLRDKHPSRGHPIPDAAYDIPVDEAAMAVDMRVPYQKLKQHVAVGPACMRSEYLRCLVGEYVPASGHCMRRRGIACGDHAWPALHAFRTSIKASARLEVRFDKMNAYIADMEAARREAPANIE